MKQITHILQVFVILSASLKIAREKKPMDDIDCCQLRVFILVIITILHKQNASLRQQKNFDSRSKQTKQETASYTNLHSQKQTQKPGFGYSAYILCQKAAIGSLEVRCEGMKLNTREIKSPQRRRKVSGKVWRTDTLIRPILLSNIHLPRSSSFQSYNQSNFPIQSENPEDRRLKKHPVTIPSHHLLLIHESKSVELKERVAFYLPHHTYAGLHAWQEEKFIPKIDGLLASWGVCQLGIEKKKYHVSELYSGYSFRNLMSEFGRFEECTARLFLRQLVSTINLLHLHGFTHNRLNLDSIFHDGQGHLLINFFKASSNPIDETERHAYLYYFSPEILLSRVGQANEKNDIWAIGCIALQFLTARTVRLHSRHPYNAVHSIEKQKRPKMISLGLKQVISKKIENEAVNFDQQSLSKEATNFIESCLQIKKEKRPTALQLLKHQFLQE